jgi:hypothetical protein
VVHLAEDIGVATSFYDLDHKQVIRFFEEYLGTNYPYDKYSQVTVQDFVWIQE